RCVSATSAAQNLVRPVGEYLVTVHVVAGTRTGLVHIDDELISMLPGEDLVGGAHDRVGEPRVEASGSLVNERSRALDPDDCVDECGKGFEAGDGKILRGPKRLDPVECGGRNGLLAEWIALDSRS